MTISAAARSKKIALQKFRRAVVLLGIPVTKAGWNVLLTKAQVDQVAKALKDGVITRGRKRA